MADLTNFWNANQTSNPGILVASGRFTSGTLKYVGSLGNWWYSSRNNEDDHNARRLLLRFDRAYGFDTGAKFDGAQVRCEL